MIQENQKQELELEETEEVQEEEEKVEPTEEVVEEKVEKPELTLEQKRGILKRQLTKVEKDLGIVEEKPKPKEEELPKKSEYSLQDIRALQDVHDDDGIDLFFLLEKAFVVQAVHVRSFTVPFPVDVLLGTDEK